eukprot:c16496_g1_i2 orf=689-1231(-)
MGLLDKLWDDVLAGPQPDNGLSRLRGKSRFPEGMDLQEAKKMAERRRSAEFLSNQEEARRVSQSIAIAKPPPIIRVDSLDPDYIGSAPSTPGAAGTPTSSSFVGSPTVWDREKHFSRTTSMPSSPALGSPGARDKENVWTSVFHPGGNQHMKKLGSEKFDKQAPNSPTVYDWVVLSALDR